MDHGGLFNRYGTRLIVSREGWIGIEPDAGGPIYRFFFDNADQEANVGASLIDNASRTGAVEPEIIEALEPLQRLEFRRIATASAIEDAARR